MDSKTTNSLIDFDNFDPFAPSAQKSGTQEITVNASSNAFVNDPFLNNFDDDNWQDAMQNLNKDQVPTSFGEAFGAFETSDNFDSDWNQKQVSSTTISLNKNEDAPNHKFFEFDSLNHKIQHVDFEKTNKELKFVGNTALNKQVHSFEKEASQADNLITDDSEITQTSNINENERDASSVGQHDRPFKGNFCSQEEGIHPINIEPSFSKIAQSSNVNEDNIEQSHGYGKDTVNENLVFVSSLEPKIEFLGDCKTTEVDCKENRKEVLLADTDVDRINVKATNGDQNCLENAETLARAQNTYFCKILSSENPETTNSGIIDVEQTGEISEEKTSFASNKEQNHKTFETDEDIHVEQNSDVVNEAGTTDKQTRNDDFENSDFMEDRPRAKKGLAGLKEYDHMEEFSYSNPSRNERDSSVSSAAEKVSSKIFNYGSALENICKQCNKRVYEMEKITVDFVIYHKSCFRCATCKRMLSPSTYSATDGQIYCKADFLRNFKMKGSYTFSPEPSHPRNDADNDARTITEDETPVVPMKYMKNLFEKNGDQAEEQSKLSVHERADVPDDPKYDVVISSNVYVLDDELPPPSLAKNLRAMFEHKNTSPVSQQSVGKGMKKQDERTSTETRKTKIENELPVVSSEPEEDGSDVPQAGITRSLLARWRDIEETGQPKERSRGRAGKRETGAMQRSQSTTRVEISQRLKVVSDDRPKMNGNLSKEEGQYIRNSSYGQSFQTSVPATKTFKWQVKEATPLNRPGIVHGDVPKYQPVVGEIISEKTPVSEINREEIHSRTDLQEENNENEEIGGDAPVKGSYVTEIREEELPDRAAVKSAMQRFKSMEDPTMEPPIPIPRKMTRVQPNRLGYRGAAMETFQPDPVNDNTNEELHEELPVSGTTKSMLAKFQSN